ncbi:hypothetical protein ACFWM0_02950 [Streptomyces sp. NPDC058405]|uniref:hypothetical protein n=1 Tax=Streptomyces sp. NPDC058405 TaxID=3346482 RepID=UPI003650D616
MVVRRGRLAFADERPYDRDSNGVLWTRTPSQPGKGRPEYGKIHPHRQRNAMEQLLCQVCGRPADRNQDGTLWLLGEDLQDPVIPTGQTGILTAHPPLCLPCAHTSVGACPHLRKQYVALRVRHTEHAGVRGALYRPAVPRPVAIDAVGIAFDDQLIHWVRAGQLLVRLTDYQPVELPE